MPEPVTHHSVEASHAIPPQWFHPVFGKADKSPLDRTALQAFAYDYFLRMLPFFRDQPEGSLRPGVQIEFTGRMRQKLGLALLFEHRIRLNLNYFLKDPRLLPYTLFHEMTHLWLYDCYLDPGHTKRFYRKMGEFEQTGLPIDQEVHIHQRHAPEAKFVYVCPNCNNRWFVAKKVRGSIYCGHCFDRYGVEYYARVASRLRAGGQAG